MKVTCPRCGFTFDLSYSRAVSCMGCPYSTLGNCGYARCPNCGYEFPVGRGLTGLRSLKA